MHTQTHMLIQQYYDHFNNQNLQAFLSLLDENIVHEINQGNKEIGINAFEAFMLRMNKSYQENAKDITIMTNQDGTRASAEFTIHGIYKATDAGLPFANNQKYSLQCGAFFEIKNNKIARVTNYYNLQEWLKQVSV